MSPPLARPPPPPPPTFNGGFQSSWSFMQVLVGFQLVDVHQNGIRFKLVNVDE
jgi:hypothetical protein